MWKDAKQKLMRKDHSVMRVNGEAELRQAHREVHAFKDDGKEEIATVGWLRVIRRIGSLILFSCSSAKSGGCHP